MRIWFSYPFAALILTLNLIFGNGFLIIEIRKLASWACKLLFFILLTNFSYLFLLSKPIITIPIWACQTFLSKIMIIFNSIITSVTPDVLSYYYSWYKWFIHLNFLSASDNTQYLPACLTLAGASTVATIFLCTILKVISSLNSTNIS